MKTKFKVKDFVKSAARAWANATLNVQKFAECYVSAVQLFEDEAREAFKAAYPMFGQREWRRMWMVGNYILMPHFVFKSDSFVGKLLKLPDHMKWQQALVSASEEGMLLVDRGKGPEKVRLSELTKKEERTLAMLMNEDDSKLSPGELIEKFSGIVRSVNKSNGRRKKKKAPSELMREMAYEIVKLESLRDDEWDMEDEPRDFWSDEKMKEHEELLDEIQASRNRLTKMVREATGDPELRV